MPRPSQYDRQAVLDTATELFWAQGYAATPLEDILTETGFNRHSLYREFGGKDGLFKAALQNYGQTFETHVASRLVSDEGLDAIRFLFEFRLPGDMQSLGCLMANTVVEGEEICGDDACRIASGFVDRLRNGLVHAIEVAQRAGDIPAHKPPSDLAEYVLAVVQGLNVLSRRGIAADTVTAIGRQTVAFLKG